MRGMCLGLNMYVCACVLMRVCVCVLCARVYVIVYRRLLRLYMCVCECLYVFFLYVCCMYACMCVCVFAYVSMYACVCMCVCLNKRICRKEVQPNQDITHLSASSRWGEWRELATLRLEIPWKDYQHWNLCLSSRVKLGVVFEGFSPLTKEWKAMGGWDETGRGNMNERVNTSYVFVYSYCFVYLFAQVFICFIHS